MTYTYEELFQTLGSYYKVKKEIEKGNYQKISHGLYTDKSLFSNELENIFLRYPKAILTLESAFAYYGMSDYVPEKYVIATSQKAHKIDNPKIEQIYITDEILNIGKGTIKTKDGFINIYDKERMLIELIRLKTKLSYPIFKEVINSYRELFKEEKIDNNKLVKYCSLFKNGENIRKQIQEVILWEQ